MITGGKDEGERNREIGTDIYTLLYIKSVTIKNLLYSSETPVNTL